jgi:hypothetical protein
MTVRPQSVDNACRDRHEARLTILPAPDGQHCLIEIDILFIERERFADAQPRCRYHPE